MRYVVTARLRPGREAALLAAVESGALGAGSVAGGEYLRNMADARLYDDGRVRWVEVCFCAEPLAEERPYWEGFFDLGRVRDAHRRSRCRDADGAEPWACCGCDCTARLGAKLAGEGRGLLDALHRVVAR
jgi:hypothetical protein